MLVKIALVYGSMNSVLFNNVKTNDFRIYVEFLEVDMVLNRLSYCESQQLRD